MSLRSNKTVLSDRILWFDGDSTYSAKDIEKALVSDGTPFADELTDQIRQYNLYAEPIKQIHVKQSNRPLSFEWDIPEEYKQLDLVAHVTDCLRRDFENDKFPEMELDERAQRVSEELLLYKKHELEPVLRVLIFVINTLDKQGVVWGVGRGSSVSSYVLYLIGVHDVDPIKYGLSIADFLH